MLKTTETFDLTEFFAGDVTAFGVFEDRFGRVRRRFTVDMIGSFEADGAFYLRENFVYDDGERIERTWRIVPTGKGCFVATAPDVLGDVVGQSTIDAVSMDYLHEIRVEGRALMLRFLDRIYKVDERSAIARTRVTKWGIKVGDVSIFFRRAQGASEQQTQATAPGVGAAAATPAASGTLGAGRSIAA